MSGEGVRRRRRLWIFNYKRRALVTGSTAGIGFAIALVLAREANRGLPMHNSVNRNIIAAL
jgi:hypothetical protein